MASAEDELRVALVVNANIKGMQTALRQMQQLTKTTAESMDASLSQIGRRRGADPTRQLQDSVSKMQGSMRAATGNMTAQLNDITSTLLSGSSPFTVMVQQGSQVTQILQSMGDAAKRTGQSFSVFQLLAGAFKNLISWQSLLVNGMILLAGTALPKVIEYFSSAGDEAKKTSEIIKEQDELIRNLADAYGVATEGLNRYSQDSQAVLQTIADQQKAVTQSRLEGAVTDVLSTTNVTAETLGNNLNYINRLNTAIATLQKSVASGHSDFKGFREALAQMANDPNAPKQIRDMAAALLEQTQEAQQLEGKQRALNAMLNGTKVAAKGATEATAALNDSIRKLNDIAADPSLKDRTKALEEYEKALAAAQTREEKDDAVRAFEAATEAINNSKEAMEEYTEKTREAMKAQEKYKDAMMDMLRVSNPELAKQLEGINAITKAWGEAAAAASNLEDRQASVLEKRANQAFAAARDAELVGDKTLELIKREEQFRSKAYGDTRTSTGKFDAWRVGYGSDTYVDQMGKVQKVTKETVVTVEQAQADLVRRSAEFQAALSEQIGPEMWASLDEGQKAALTSIAYNYGSAAKAVKNLTSQIREGASRESIANQIANLGANPERRKREADLYGGSGYSPPKEAKKTYDELTKSIKEKTAAQEYENKVNADNTTSEYAKLYAIEKQAATVELLNAAKEQGLTIDERLRAEIDQNADALARQRASMKLLTDARQADNKRTEDQRRQQAQLADQIANVAQSAISGLVNDLRNGVDAGEAFANMLNRIVDGLLNMVIQSLFAKDALGGVLSNFLGGFGGGGAVIAHAGGTVGMSRHTDGRSFSPLTWAGAPRFAVGGIVGLRPGEVPIIAHRGEMIVPAGQVSRGGSVTGDDNRQYNVAIKVDSNGRANLTEGNGTILGKKLNMAVQEVIAKEQRSGGLLAGTGPGRR